jgi:protein-disulfide isomerase
MTSSFFRSLLVTAAGAGLLFSATSAQAFTEAEKAELGTIIHEYIMENPQVLFEATDKYRADQEAQAELEAQEALKSNYDALTSKDAPFLGNPDGDIVVVEFYDYNCGYCKRALPDLMALVDENKDVRVVLHDMPILGPSSRTAALWAMAAHEQGKYPEYHAALMKHSGGKDEAALSRLAKDVGLDVEKLKADAQSQKVSAAVDESVALARSLGISGTPAFIVEGQMFRGYIGEAGLKAAVEQARKDKQS